MVADVMRGERADLSIECISSNFLRIDGAMAPLLALRRGRGSGHTFRSLRRCRRLLATAPARSLIRACFTDLIELNISFGGLSEYNGSGAIPQLSLDFSSASTLSTGP